MKVKPDLSILGHSMMGTGSAGGVQSLNSKNAATFLNNEVNQF